MKIRVCRSRTVRATILLVLALFTMSEAARAFDLASLNCLHLGWGKQDYQTDKNKMLKGFFEKSNAPVIVLQEVMAQANIGDVAPGTHVFTFTPLQGPGTYKEAYAFLYKSGMNVSSVTITTVPGFSRPPAGVAISEGGTCTWVVNYHAIFGRSITQRREEAKLIPRVINEFAQKNSRCQRVVIAGDWNLPVNEVATASRTNVNDIQPNTRTSLKKNGELSQSYDHFLAANGVTLNNVEVVGQQNQQERQQWRKSVSDHLPIKCTVN